MTQSINSTISSALTEAGVSEYSRSSYQSYIDAVEKAVTERDYQISEALIEAASQQGIGERHATLLLVNAGLSVRPVVVPEPVAVEVEVEEEVTVEEDVVEGGKSKGKNGKRIDALEEKIDTLSGSIAQLVQLANRHLGASL